MNSIKGSLIHSMQKISVMELHAKDILAHGMQACSHSAQVQALQQAQLARLKDV